MIANVHACSGLSHLVIMPSVSNFEGSPLVAFSDIYHLLRLTSEHIARLYFYILFYFLISFMPQNVSEILRHEHMLHEHMLHSASHMLKKLWPWDTTTHISHKQSMVAQFFLSESEDSVVYSGILKPPWITYQESVFTTKNNKQSLWTGVKNC